MKRSWWIVGTAVGVLSAIYLAWWWWSVVEVQAMPAQRREIREFVDELAKTRLPDRYEITMPFAARIEPITLREGDAVAAGSVVARVSEEDLDTDVTEAQAAVDRLDASVAENEDSRVERSAKTQSEHYVKSMASTIAAAEARVESGLARLNFTESVLRRTQKLAETVSVSDEQLEKANLDFIQSMNDHRQDLLIAESLKSLQAATDLLPKMVDDYIDHKGLSKRTIELEKAEASARLRRARTKQQRGQLVSPIHGIVLDRPQHEEQFLPAGALVMTVGRMEDLEVELDVLSQEVVNIQVGQPAEIYGAGVARQLGHGLKGTVHQIYPSAFTKISSLGVEQQRVKVVVRMEPGELQTGTSRVGVDFRVRVRIVTATKLDAIVVPRSALFRGPQDQWQVFVIRRGRSQLQDVELGASNDQQVEIVSGVKENELVILSPEHSLLPGARVHPLMR